MEDENKLVSDIACPEENILTCLYKVRKVKVIKLYRVLLL